MTDLVTIISDERLAEVGTTLNFFASVIKSGETWTAACQRDFDNAHAALTDLRAQGGARVNAQNWREEGKGWFRAPSELGAYNITHYAGMTSEGFKLEYGGGFTSYFSSLEEAKAAAQADYERRILSSLEASPAPVSGEILRRIHDALEMSIPHALEFDAESGGYYDTDLSRELRVLADALAAKGGQ